MQADSSIYQLVTALRSPWAISDDGMECVLNSLESAAGKSLDYPTPADDREPRDIGDGIYELSILGPLMQRPSAIARSLLGAGDLNEIQVFAEQLASNPAVKGVLLNVNSPGGTVMGTPETAAAIRQLSQVKPTLAYTDAFMASGAYWLASQARGVVASPSALVGSIGVMLPVLDQSKLFANIGVKIDVITNDGAIFKGAGVPGTSLSEDQRAQIVERLNASAADFKNSVLSMRPKVKQDAMRGQVFLAAQARADGLVDALGSYQTALNHLKSFIK
jgi:signal peptide peptidase SppA